MMGHINNSQSYAGTRPGCGPSSSMYRSGSLPNLQSACEGMNPARIFTAVHGVGCSILVLMQPLSPRSSHKVATARYSGGRGPRAVSRSVHFRRLHCYWAAA